MLESFRKLKNRMRPKWSSFVRPMKSKKASWWRNIKIWWKKKKNTYQCLRGCLWTNPSNRLKELQKNNYTKPISSSSTKHLSWASFLTLSTRVRGEEHCQGVGRYMRESRARLHAINSLQLPNPPTQRFSEYAFSWFWVNNIMENHSLFSSSDS